MYLIKSHFKFFFSITVLFLSGCLFSSCNKNENEVLQNSIDLNGFWIIDEVITGNCSGSNETEQSTEIFSVQQSDNGIKITMYPNGDVLDGQLKGNILTWSGTLPTVSGKMDIDFKGTISPEANKMSGEGDWEWYNETFTCSGTTAITGNKIQSEDVDFSGSWSGIWESEENYIDGTFMVKVIQNGNSLSGTISVSDIGMENASLSGMVNGNVVYFGDIEGEIKFVGIYDDNLASGTYSYKSLSDEGSWTASNLEENNSGKLVAVDSFLLETWCDDMTWDGEYFYMLSNLEISCVDKTGIVLFNYPAPGNYATGIAYNGENLLVGDNGWGTNKIYKLLPSEKNLMYLPFDGDVAGAFSDGNNFWFGTDSYNDITIVQTTSEGTILKSFPFSGKRFHGLALDSENIWISYEDSELFSNTVLAKVDKSGNLLDTFRLEDGLYGRLAYDGKNIWMATPDMFYAFNSDGDISETLTVTTSGSDANIAGFTFDGTNFWYATSGAFEEHNKVFCVSSESGVLTGSFDCPGENTVGLTYDGKNLKVADRATGRLYTIPVSGDYYLPYPDFDFSSMSADAGHIFVFDSYNEKMVILNNSADEVDNFSVILDWNGNFYYDGEYYWSALNFLGNLQKIIKFNGEGKTVAYYQSDKTIQSVSSLVVEGNDIWCVAGNLDGNPQLLHLQINGSE